MVGILAPGRLIGKPSKGASAPVYSPSFDLSNAQNSQYVPVIFAGF